MQETVRRYRSRSRYTGQGTADLSWQERIRRVGNPYGYVTEGNRRERMTFGIQLPEIGADMQPIYYGARRESGRVARMERERRQQAEREIPRFSRSGVRGTVALALAVGLALVLLISWNASRLEIRATDRRTARTESRLAEIERRCELLTAEFEEKAASVDVAYTAAGQGMISSKGAARIAIAVPESAVVMPYGTAAE